MDPAEPVETPAAPASKGLSILVAEDNEINALLMRSLLSRLGHRAVITTNGEAALESWLSAKSAGSPYDLVFMDIQMPQLNGIETTKRIRAMEAGQPGRRTPILALTANTLVEDRYACFEAGMDGFLIKPLDREKLAEAIAGLAASRHIAAVRARQREDRSKPPQRDRLDDVIGALLEDQGRARPRRQDVFLEIGEVGALPDRGCGRDGLFVGQRRIAMEVGLADR